MNELQEMYPRFQEYWRDKWNWLEALSLVLLSAGLWIRIVDEDVSQGRAMFALSAPLVFSRILFFGQILPRQGIMIQVHLPTSSDALRLLPSMRALSRPCTTCPSAPSIHEFRGKRHTSYLLLACTTYSPPHYTPYVICHTSFAGAKEN